MLSAPRGTRDLLPGEAERWRFMEETAINIARRYGFREIRTPIFEHTELFQRGVGTDTDIVDKEMYTFTDRGNRSMTLRPEGTAPVVRAFLQNNLGVGSDPGKLFYLGPMFRYERPQGGRMRQFHQFGVELFGVAEAVADMEVILLAADFLQELGIKGVQLHLNNIGCPRCRPLYRERLQVYLEGKIGSLCSDCRRRWQTNPLRVLDCKQEKCQEIIADAPSLEGFLCGECRSHFEMLLELLTDLSVDYTLNPRLVRGLDYYTKTTFEFIPGEGQGTVIGGGRYDGLVEALGGNPTPGVGFAVGLERLYPMLPPAKKQFALDVYVASAGKLPASTVYPVVRRLRAAGLKTDYDFHSRSLRAQMKSADRLESAFALIIGEEEMQTGVAVLRRMADGQQQELPLETVEEKLQQIKEVIDED